ncbi:MAG: glycosyltransferase family 4 protein [Candidatus Eremiobacteraeota bacterium]|nr:glycosyltransferase family 4 protein [Candidatus Eremiobacteraeota bacterium]
MTKKIVLITQGDPGKLTGGFLYHQKLAELFPEFGCKLEFLSFPEWPFPLPFAALPLVLKQWWEARPDATLVDSLIACYFWPLALLSAPFVGIVHQLPGGIDHTPLRTSLQAALDRFVYRRAGALIACSGWLAETLSDLQRPVFVAQPGCERVGKRGEKPDLLRGHGAAILSVANWQPVKGVELLLEAFSRLPQGVATLHLVGNQRLETSYGQSVQARVSKPDLVGRVFVHGVVEPDRLKGYYSSADIFALASHGETYGSVYAEALTAGLPIVGWRTGNLPHLVENEITGLLAEFGETEELAASLERLSVDSELRQRMSARALERAESLPTWTDAARRVLEALRVGA